MVFPIQGLKPLAIVHRPCGARGSPAIRALEGRSIIARGFTPWKREKEKTGALKGRLIIHAYPEINPHKMEENHTL